MSQSQSYCSVEYLSVAEAIDIDTWKTKYHLVSWDPAKLNQHKYIRKSQTKYHLDIVIQFKYAPCN